MTCDYHPPCTVTPEILSRVAKIAEQVGRLAAGDGMALRLRRVNRIRTIHGSLAIEGNTLSEEMVTAILAGRRVTAPPREILEVQNAGRVYDNLWRWNPTRQEDLLSAHRMLMEGLLELPGRFRDGGVGVMGTAGIVHVAPPADRVPKLMADLLHWLGQTDLHPLVAGSIFHYEFEVIHPFADGNGRMGRLWHSLILCRWQPLFADLPTESMIHARQQDYYEALNQSTSRSDSAPFVTFMLEVIQNTLEGFATPQVTPQVKTLLQVLRGEMSRSELMQVLGLADRKSFRERYLLPALEAGLIEMTLPDKPRSRLQRYRLVNRVKK